ncbi:MAG: DUF1552 domain-containing protein, partial [Planctomycetota bacterium]
MKVECSGHSIDRRELMRRLGISAAAASLVGWLPSLALAKCAIRKQRVIWMFSPNGVVPPSFWPAETGSEFKLPEILQPLEPFRDRLLILK